MNKPKEKRRITRTIEPEKGRVYQVLKPYRFQDCPGKIWEDYGRTYTKRGLKNLIDGSPDYDFVMDIDIQQELGTLASKV